MIMVKIQVQIMLKYIFKEIVYETEKSKYFTTPDDFM